MPDLHLPAIAEEVADKRRVCLPGLLAIVRQTYPLTWLL